MENNNRVNPFAGMSRQALMDYVAKNRKGARITAADLHRKFRAISEEAKPKRGDDQQA